MFATILMALVAIVFVVGIIMILRNKRVNVDGSTYSTRMPATIATGIAFVLLLGLGFWNCTYSQDPGQARVLRSFTGQLVDTNTQPGLGFKAPWVDDIEYDIRNQVVTYVGDGKNQTGPAITAQDKDSATASIDIVVRYSIDPSQVADIYNKFQTQDNFVSRLIQNDVRSVVRNIPLKYSTATFRQSREAAALEIGKALSERWKNDGVIVDAVDLRDIRYPEAIENSLRDIQTAKNNAAKATADLETAKVAAEKTRVEAQAQSDYDQIVRCGAKTQPVTEVVNGQTITATKVIPLLGAECQNKLNEQVLTNKYIDALKEIAGKQGNMIITDGKTVPMVTIPSPPK